MSRFVMAIDAHKCMNCKACVLACQQTNAVAFGHYRNWIKSSPDAAAPSGIHYQPGGCMQCDKPICVEACPTGATYKSTDGVVYVNPQVCIGCGNCIKSCPYSARYKDPQRGVADKCDYCLTARQRGEEPACVRICPTRARVFGDAEDPASDVSKVLAANKVVKVEATQVKTDPSLVYVGSTQPLDWPENTELPGTMAAMGTVATGVRWLGGLALLGVVGCFFKQLVLPSDKEDGQDKH